MNRFSNKLTVLSVAALLFAAIGCMDQKAKSSKDAKWAPLFDGRTLNGWKKLGGDGKFYVEDGVIVSRPVVGTPGTFLCTEKTYGDFILELEFKIDTPLNSGVQIRSDVHKKDTTVQYRGYSSGKMQVKPRTFKAGTVYGYQIEVDPSQRAWSGGFYEAGGRGWIQSLKDNEAARRAFKNGKWNKFHIEAIGNSFKTWINGVPAVDLTDSMRATGFIGLQLHRTDAKEHEDKTVQWRNIRIKNLD